MFVLTAPAGPVWIDVAPDIRIAFRAAGTECLAAGRKAARLALLTEEVLDLGVAFVLGCAAWGAVEWEGIGDENGEPLAISADNVVMLLRQRPDIFEVVDDRYVEPVMRLLDEKKGSSRSQTGTSEAAAPSTAMPAPSATKTPPTAPSVPTAKTKPAPRRAKPSGPPSEPVAVS